MTSAGPGDIKKDFRSCDVQLIRNSVVLGLLLTLALSASCRKKEKLAIAVVPKGQNSAFWQAVRAGAMAAGRDLGVQILWNSPASEIDSARQLSIVDEFINQRVNGIALAPANSESLVPIVERAAQERIPVTIFDSGIRTEKYVSFVSSDNYRGGALAARRMGTVIAAGGQIAILGSVPGSTSTAERENGFRETIAREFPSLQIVEFQYGMGDRAQSIAVAKGIFAAHPELSGIFCSSEAGTAGVLESAGDTRVAGRVKIVGFDTGPELVQGIRSGRIDSLIVQDPFRMGYMSVKTLVEHLRGEAPEKQIDTGIVLVTAENLMRPEIQKLVVPPIENYVR
jgi:ribose transport system substrate-binding protein